MDEEEAFMIRRKVLLSDMGFEEYIAKQQAEIGKLKNNFKSLRQWVDDKLCELDAADGYNYDSGVEYGLREVAIKMGKMK